MDEHDEKKGPTWNVGGGAYDDDAAELASMGVITVGDLLSTSARAVGSSFVAFVVISLLVQLPAIGLNVAAQEWLAHKLASFDPYSADAGLDLAFAVFTVNLGSGMVQTVFTFLAQASLMYATVQFMAGRRASIGESLAGGFSNIATVLALAFLNTIAISLATLACFIPGIVVGCILFASVPAAVVERLGPIEAMQRSSDLTLGHRMTIFLAGLVIGLVWFTFACTANLGLGGADAAPGAVLPSLPARVMGYAIDWGLALVLTIFQAALAGVFYARVRGVRDGVDADAIAREFE